MPDFKELTGAASHVAYAWYAYGFVAAAMIGGVWVTKRGLRGALERAARQIERATNETPPREG